MKKILSLLLLTLSASAMAQHPGHGNRNVYRPGPIGYQHGHHQGHWARSHGGNWVWMVPALIGSAIIYENIRQQPPVIIQQQPLVMPPLSAENCSPWTEVQSSDGTITRTRTCSTQ
jgi:hypothetical protein